MADVTVFHYQVGSSCLHRLDIRFMLLSVVVLNLVVLNSGYGGLGLMTLILFWVMLRLQLSWRVVIRELRVFLWLLLFVFLSRCLFTPGEAFVAWGPVVVTTQGIIDGGRVCWRLLAVVGVGLVFVRTASPDAIKAGVEWYLRPIPGIPEKRVGTIMSLMIRFLPVILDQAREIADAQRSRGVENRYNPVFRLTIFVLPFMRGIFLSADDLIVAMEARGYSENRTDPELSSTPADWCGFLRIIGCCVAIFVVDIW